MPLLLLLIFLLVEKERRRKKFYRANPTFIFAQSHAFFTSQIEKAKLDTKSFSEKNKEGPEEKPLPIAIPKPA
jgi:hypothetical protein